MAGNRRTWTDKVGAIGKGFAMAFVVVGVFGLLILACAHLVFPLICAISGGVSTLWVQGPLGKACVFAALALTGLIILRFPSWYASITSSDDSAG